MTVSTCQKAIYLVFTSGLLAMMLFSCEAERRDTFVPDTSNIEVSLDVRRFEQDLFQLDTTDMINQLAKLEQQYPEFSNLFFSQILRSKTPETPFEAHADFVNGFINHPEVRHLYDTCMILYQDMPEEIDKLEEALTLLKYYFPDLPTPDLTTFISEYTIAAFIYKEQSLAVGLDFFLGDEHPYQAKNPLNTNFSNYITRTFNRAHFTEKVLTPLAEDLVGPPSGSQLLDQMIRNGKKLYLLEHLLPYEADSVLLEVTEEQTNWLFDNEFEIWAYFLQEDLLFSTEWSKIRKYVEYSPNSPGMPKEAPGRTGNFIGWRIIQKWMENKYPGEPNLNALLAETDAQAILNQSRYKPKRK